MYGKHLVEPYSIWFHVKTGNYYVVLGLSRDSTNATEGAEAVVYWSQTHKAMRHRLASEFLDGRFVPCTQDGKPMTFGPEAGR